MHLHTYESEFEIPKEDYPVINHSFNNAISWDFDVENI